MFVVKEITILYIDEFTGICYFCLFVDSIIFSRGINRVWKVPVFGVILVCIQSECGKIRTRITPNTDTFYAVNNLTLMELNQYGPFIAFLLLKNESQNQIQRIKTCFSSKAKCIICFFENLL